MAIHSILRFQSQLYINWKKNNCKWIFDKKVFLQTNREKPKPNQTITVGFFEKAKTLSKKIKSKESNSKAELLKKI